MVLLGPPAAGPGSLPGALDDRQPQRLRELQEKYDLLIALRKAPPGRTPARRDGLRAVADRFPGALREWDALPLVELERRRATVAAALAEAAAGAVPAALQGAAELWLRLALDLHPHLRALLRLRRWLRGRGPIDEELVAGAQRVYDAGGATWPERLGPARLRRIAAPPAGRLAEVVYADLAARHGLSVAAVKRALYAEPSPAAHPEGG